MRRAGSASGKGGRGNWAPWLFFFKFWLLHGSFESEKEFIKSVDRKGKERKGTAVEVIVCARNHFLMINFFTQRGTKLTNERWLK
jgi:hypothetical protein